MTKQQNNKRTMMQSVVSLIETNAARTSSIQELVTSAEKLKNVVGQMYDKTVEVAEASAGKAAAKMEARNELRVALLTVKAGLFAYAVKQGDTQLQTKANISNRIAVRSRDADLLASAEVILKLAKEAGQALEPHGITADVMSAFESSFEDFRAMIGSVKTGVAVRVAARKSLEELFAEADGILADELDRYFEILQQSDPEIVNAYFQARYIGKPGYRHAASEPEMILQQAPVAKAA